MAGESMIAKGLRTPRAAAIAGIMFSVLIGVSVVLLKLALPPDPTEAGRWLSDGGSRTAVVVAINLVPFAGIAFLWFIGVIRDRMGEREDKFFATVFLGSGLLFVALLFAATAMAFGMLAGFDAAPSTAAEIEVWDFGSQATLALLNVFAMRMAAVFVISTCTIALRTAVIHRWLSYIGLAIAILMLVAVGFVPFVNVLFPLWIFVVSLEILIKNLRGGREPSQALQGESG
ncbi:MAG: hypothetical protein C4536_02540 [Actinobacteria bacterium]|nr:MAG: hypothetical protein C4536_02540 [Actinomycetota bacterium]